MKKYLKAMIVPFVIIMNSIIGVVLCSMSSNVNCATIMESGIKTIGGMIIFEVIVIVIIEILVLFLKED